LTNAIGTPGEILSSYKKVVRYRLRVKNLLTVLGSLGELSLPVFAGLLIELNVQSKEKDADWLDDRVFYLMVAAISLGVFCALCE
jgi:hypothetical protein